MSGLLIVGAGGHGKVVAELAEISGQWDKLAFIDDRYPGLKSIFHWSVIGKAVEAEHFIKDYPYMIVAVGDNALRLRLLQKYSQVGFQFATLIHPSASVSPNASIGRGSVIFAQAVVNIGAKVGEGVIINTGATVDHDCILEEGVHLSPGCHLGGGVKVGSKSWLGVGANVVHQVTIGENVTVGAGSTIINTTESDVTIVGVPGKVIKYHNAEVE